MDSNIPKEIEETKDKNELKDKKAHKEKDIAIYPLENIENLDDFDEINYQNRKYNSNNLENSKKFFKFRYLKEKIKEAQERNASNIKNENENILLIKLNAIEKEKLLKYENLLLTYEKTKEKNIQKYSRLFLILIEKSIFYFNIEQFKESYSILLNNGIIKNPFEFGEILYTINGYDKELIGDYLTKNEELNEKIEIIKGLINTIEMDKFENIMDCFKYICCKISIPKDTRVKTLVINQISSCYYEEHKNSDNFKKKFKNDQKNIGIFLNAIINTINSLDKGDFKIKLKDFTIMVDFIEKEEMTKIYEAIKTLKLKLDYDYLKEFYDRILIILKLKNFDPDKEKEKNKEENQLKSLEKTNYYEYLEEKQLYKEENIDINIIKFRIIHLLISFTSLDQQFLTSPKNFYRISGTNATNLKEYILVENFTKIAFEKNLAETPKLKHYISMDDIIEIYIGNSIGENLKKYLKANPQEEFNQNNYITIICNKEQIDLKSTNIDEGIIWFKSLKNCLLFHRNYLRDIKMKNEEKKIKEELESIWENYILKKWETYGNYFLFKCLDHSNFLAEMYFDGKPQISTIKIDIYEEKKLPFVKVIHNFLKEVKEKLSKKDDRILEYNDFLVLCHLGMPEYSRQKIWPILFGNKCGITNSLYESLKGTITRINNFEELELKYKENMEFNFSGNNLVNKIIKDIIKIKYLFFNENEEKKNSKEIMSQVYSICICFFYHRFDIAYNKNIIPIIYLLLLNNITEENAFIIIYNLICSNNCISKLYLWDERYIKNLEIILEKAISEHLPKLKQHFKLYGINCSLYLYDWIENLFTQILDQKIASIIIELYLIYGDYILIQTSITILKLLEGYLINLTIDDTFIALKRMPFDLSIVNFFDTFRNYITIKEKFRDDNVASEFAIQTTILFEPSE